jgi:hypothetical protein
VGDEAFTFLVSEPSEPHVRSVQWRVWGRSLVMVATASSVAHADPPTRAAWTPMFLDGAFELGVKRLRRLPDVTVFGADVSRGGQVPVGEPLTMTTAGASVGLAVSERWVLNLARIGASFAVGRSSRVVSAVDGQLTEVRPWTTAQIDMEMWGVTWRTKVRRWLFEAGLWPGVSVMWMKASMASGDESAGTTGFAVSGVLRGDLAACRRLDPKTRICLAVSPLIYEHGFLNGGAVSLRWEVGP